jgi:hypothetical protein
VPRAVHTIAWVGGTPGNYIELDVTKFLRLVLAKYPDTEHVVGSDKGAEAQVCEYLALVGAKFTQPPIYVELPEAKLLQVCNIIAEADAVVLMGTKGGQRVKLALEILKRVDTCREEWNKRHVHHIALEAPKKQEPKKKARSKKQREAREHA